MARTGATAVKAALACLDEAELIDLTRDLIRISSVVRPGDQIDTSLDENKIPPGTTLAPPGTPRPLVPFKESDFWAQGLTFGLEFTW